MDSSSVNPFLCYENPKKLIFSCPTYTFFSVCYLEIMSSPTFSFQIYNVGPTSRRVSRTTGLVIKGYRIELKVHVLQCLVQ